jgi:GYD domain
VGAKIIAGGYSYGEYDVSTIVEAPDDVTMAAVALAIAAGGAVKAAKTTPWLTGLSGLRPSRRRLPSAPSTGPPGRRCAIGPATTEPSADQLTLRCNWLAAQVQYSPGRFLCYLRSRSEQLDSGSPGNYAAADDQIGAIRDTSQSAAPSRGEPVHPVKVRHHGAKKGPE